MIKLNLIVCEQAHSMRQQVLFFFEIKTISNCLYNGNVRTQLLSRLH